MDGLLVLLAHVVVLDELLHYVGHELALLPCLDALVVDQDLRHERVPVVEGRELALLYLRTDELHLLLLEQLRLQLLQIFVVLDVGVLALDLNLIIPSFGRNRCFNYRYEPLLKIFKGLLVLHVDSEACRILSVKLVEARLSLGLFSLHLDQASVGLSLAQPQTQKLFLLLVVAVITEHALVSLAVGDDHDEAARTVAADHPSGDAEGWPQGCLPRGRDVAQGDVLEFEIGDFHAVFLAIVSAHIVEILEAVEVNFDVTVLVDLAGELPVRDFDDLGLILAGDLLQDDVGAEEHEADLAGDGLGHGQNDVFALLLLAGHLLQDGLDHAQYDFVLAEVFDVGLAAGVGACILPQLVQHGYLVFLNLHIYLGLLELLHHGGQLLVGLELVGVSQLDYFLLHGGTVVDEEQQDGALTGLGFVRHAAGLLDDDLGLVLGEVGPLLLDEVLGATEAAIPDVVGPLVPAHDVHLVLDVAVVVLVAADPVPVVDVVAVLVGEHHPAVVVLAVGELLHLLVLVQLGHLDHEGVEGLAMAVFLLLAAALELPEVDDPILEHWLRHPEIIDKNVVISVAGQRTELLLDEVHSRLDIGEVAGALVLAQNFLGLAPQHQLHLVHRQLETGQVVGALQHCQDQAGDQLVLLQHLELRDQPLIDQLLLVGEDVLLQSHPHINDTLDLAQDAVLLGEVGHRLPGLGEQQLPPLLP